MRGDIIKRCDGRTEWLCEHGVGHTIGVPKGKENDTSIWVHGCDGCCKSAEAKRLRKNLRRKTNRQSFKCASCGKPTSRVMGSTRDRCEYCIINKKVAL